MKLINQLKFKIMATDLEIENAKKLINDNIDLDAALIDLPAILATGDPIELFIKSGDYQFNLNRLLAMLESSDANYDAMVAAIQASIITMLGADEVTIGTLRKALKDLVTANDVVIAAT